MIFALVLLSAVDSLVTYWTIQHGIAFERNPGIDWLIGQMGLANAMVAIFGWKVTLFAYLRHFRRFRLAQLAVQYLFVVYLGVLIPCWVSVARLYYWP